MVEPAKRRITLKLSETKLLKEYDGEKSELLD